jgi:hypothetical protein
MLGWNGRLVYTFAGGCGGGHHQGLLVDLLTDYEPLLAQGYALATSSLNYPQNTCDDKISAETTSMVKEHFIKEYGEPDHTIGIGQSGGAASVYLIAQDYPGILDGIIAYSSAPDIISSVIPAFSDCSLLQHAVDGSKFPWTEAQKTAISGYATWQACTSVATWFARFGWLDPKSCDPSLSKEAIYDAISNPTGTRCTYYDNSVNVFGRDPKTGFARRTLDNVGIQYGLVAFRTGQISVDQFIELNERVGGFDANGQIIPERSNADPVALLAAYRFGELVTGKSLGNVPIIDWNRYVDDSADMHTRDRTFLVRERLITANGDAANQAVLVTPRPFYEGLTLFDIRPFPGVGWPVLVPQMDRWLTTIAADKTNLTLRAKIVGDKPAELADGCIATDGERIVEPATYDGAGLCNRIYPNHGNPRVAAGAPIAGDILKCALKPLDPSDYPQPLKPDQINRLQATFPIGVCDYSRPGVGADFQPILWHAIAP